MMKTITKMTGLALLLCLVIGTNGCILEEVLTDLVAKHEACATYEQRETSANWNTPFVLDNYGKDLRQALADIGYSPADGDSIMSAALVAAHYGVLQIIRAQAGTTITGTITVQRQGGASGVLIDYTSVAIEGAVGKKIVANLNGAGVHVINTALRDLIANLEGDPNNDPVLILNDVNGSVTPEPTVSEPLDFDWKAWITVEMVIRMKIDVPDPWG